jgi:DHA1 family tetracycline resistance protein-like MFS transporter
MLIAIMSKAVPDDAQGELQGGISSIMNIAMLFGTVFFAQIFGHFMQPDAVLQSPDVAFFIAAGVMAVALALFVVTARRTKPTFGASGAN